MRDYRGTPTGRLPFEAAATEVRETCVRYLGEPAGSQLAALARPGYDLRPIRPGGRATGRSALGGPALLDPGTPWPEYLGLPLSLVAVLDTGAMAGWLGDHLPERTGLLNFFIFDPTVADPTGYDWHGPGSWRVVPADPDRAVPVRASNPAARYDRYPLRAGRMVTLPDTDDPVLEVLEFDPEPDIPVPSVVLSDSGFAEHWRDRRPKKHQAFGWPVLELGAAFPDEREHTLLLKLVDFPIDRPVTWFTIPTEAFRVGDFSQVVSQMETF